MAVFMPMLWHVSQQQNILGAQPDPGCVFGAVPIRRVGAAPVPGAVRQAEAALGVGDVPA